MCLDRSSPDLRRHVINSPSPSLLHFQISFFLFRTINDGNEGDRVCGHIAALRNKLHQEFKSDRRALGDLHYML